MRYFFIASLLASLCCLWQSPAALAEPVSVQVSPSTVRQVDTRYLSLALDTSVLLGGEWWTAKNQLDLSDPRLRVLTQALAPAYLRLGGTDADRVYYHFEEGPAPQPLPAGYTLLLKRQRWQELMDFAHDVQMPVIFTLNAGPGPRSADQVWQSDNARSLVSHATQAQDPVAVWELGNEINGFGPLLNVWLSPSQYGRDLLEARKLLQSTGSPARLAGPASAFWPLWQEPLAVLPEALRVGGAALDIVSWHYYPQQSSRCPLATRRARLKTLLQPDALDTILSSASSVHKQQQQSAVQAESWLGETGHAQCGGEPGISGRYVSSLWWLDQLGLLAKSQQVQVRQALVGSDYGLLDETSGEPTPDYWASLLWKRLMGPGVLQTQQTGPPSLRTYAHCRPDQKGWTLLLLNLDPEQALPVYLPYPHPQAQLYQLSARSLDSRQLRLNGKTLVFHTQLPELKGQPLSHSQLSLPPASASFVAFDFPNWPGCQGA